MDISVFGCGLKFAFAFGFAFAFTALDIGELFGGRRQSSDGTGPKRNTPVFAMLNVFTREKST